MIKLENWEVVGWEHAIRGMRNPKNSWEKTDSEVVDCDDLACSECSLCRDPEPCLGRGSPWMYDGIPLIGPNDHDLMMRLAKGGPVHAKYRRMITVYVDITAPLYWWKEFDTYKVGTVANSCSTMHKIHAKELTLEDFSHECLKPEALACLEMTIRCMNAYREMYLKDGNYDDWIQIIQSLPTSFNQRRTIMLNYEVLHNIYFSRKNHKLKEWHVLCDWIKSLPYSEIITLEEEE